MGRGSPGNTIAVFCRFQTQSTELGLQVVETDARQTTESIILSIYF
jgi:hypothetical protein